MKILTVGTTFVDIKGHPHGKFIPSGRNSGDIEYVHGGVGRNIAEDVAHLGCGSSLLSLIDFSGIGKEVKLRLTGQDIDTSFVREAENGMGTWLAVFDGRGDVAAAISKRPDLSAIPGILDRDGEKIVSDADAVIAEIDMGRDIMIKLFALAESRKIPVFTVLSNIAFALENRDLICRSRCFICNRMEAEVFYGIGFGADAESADTLLRKVRENGMKSAVVTLGEDGAIYADTDGVHGHCPAIPADVVDTTGAGDAFTAGLAVGLCSGKPLADACRIGAYAASKAVATLGNVCPPLDCEVDL